MVIRILTLVLAVLLVAGAAQSEIVEIVETQEILAFDEAVTATVALAPPTVHPVPAEVWRHDLPPSPPPLAEIFRPPRLRMSGRRSVSR